MLQNWSQPLSRDLQKTKFLILFNFEPLLLSLWSRYQPKTNLWWFTWLCSSYAKIWSSLCCDQKCYLNELKVTMVFNFYFFTFSSPIRCFKSRFLGGRSGCLLSLLGWKIDFWPYFNNKMMFSSLKLLKSDLRNWLKGDIVDSIIFLCCNKGLKHSVKNDKKKKAWFEFITYLYFCLNTCLFHNKSFFFLIQNSFLPLVIVYTFYVFLLLRVQT